RLRAAAACVVRVPPTSSTTTAATTTTPVESCAPSLDPAGNLTNGVGTLRDVGVRPLGTLNAAMLFVDFPDAAATETTRSLYDLLAPQAQTYFANESYGRFTLRI